MGFLKFANASVVKPAISMPAWDEVRARAVALGPAFDTRTAQKQVILQKFNPKQYMLTHCTIIASVDTEDTGLPLGKHMVDGMEINRRYSDFIITPQTSKYINNNSDAWERRLLLSCFRTFIGGENYIEHLQIPELSKGKIIDAAARDIGDSVYVDILVATDLRHAPLIAAVRSGQLQTLSMGCQVQWTQCTKCGNVAEDETNLCPHVRYMKGNTFIDGLGRTRKIAELCGHHTDPQSVKFIEASWVGNPAFTGAVLRNILSVEEVKLLGEGVGERIQVAFSQPARTADASAMQRAARTVRRAQFGDEPEFPGADGVEPKSEGAPMDKAVDEMAEFIREKAMAKLKGEMAVDEAGPRADLDENENDTLIKEAVFQSPEWRAVAKAVLAQAKDPKIARRMLLGLILHKRGGWGAVQASNKFSGRDILAISRFLDNFSQGQRIAGEGRLYRVVMTVGGVAAYGNDVESYLAACRRVLGRQLTGSERDALIVKGRLFDLGH